MATCDSTFYYEVCLCVCVLSACSLERSLGGLSCSSNSFKHTHQIYIYSYTNKKRTENFCVLHLPTYVRFIHTPDAFVSILFINFCWSRPGRNLLPALRAPFSSLSSSKLKLRTLMVRSFVSFAAAKRTQHAPIYLLYRNVFLIDAHSLADNSHTSFVPTLAIKFKFHFQLWKIDISKWVSFHVPLVPPIFEAIGRRRPSDAMWRHNKHISEIA